MLVVVFKTVILSIVFIFVVHQIIQFLTDSLTIPKTKDLVSIIEKKYDEIHKTLQEAPRIVPEPGVFSSPNLPGTTKLTDLPLYADGILNNDSIPVNDPIPASSLTDMRSELQLFIKQSQR